MKIQLVRHATLLLEYPGWRVLVDPMLCDAGVNPPITNSANDRRNPLVPLPLPLTELLQVDAVLVTHLHRDHWDEEAMRVVSRSMPILCQPVDQDRFIERGFNKVIPLESSVSMGPCTIERTSGQHGKGEIGVRMGPVSGFVLQAAGQPTVYIAGDTIWCEEVRQALDKFRPDITIVNAGGARFLEGDPITMTAGDVMQVFRYAPYTKVVAVHMDAINHCLESRGELAERLTAAGLSDLVQIPQDGEWLW